MKILIGINKLIKNLAYLSKNDLENKNKEYDTIYQAIRHTEDLLKSDMVFTNDNSLKILSNSETWEKILVNPKSFLRIGDGELTLINGKSIDFQSYDKKLADYLIEILQNKRDDIYVGIEYMYFHEFNNIIYTVRKHNYLWGPIFKKTLLKYCNSEKKYISASFNQIYMNVVECDWDNYLNNMKKLFKDKDIVVFAGNGIFDNIQYNLFDNARSCEYVWSLSKNSFTEFDKLLNKARNYTKDKVLCFVLGPTSKPLVYKLSEEGYISWDIGHMAKDYDCCMKRAPRNEENIIRFYAPD